MHSQIIYFCNL